VIQEGVGLSTEDLFAHAGGQLRTLKRLAVTRRQREKAMDLMTELFLTVDEISRHLGGLSFTERPVSRDEDEDEGREKRMPMSDLFPAEEEEADVEEDAAEVQELREAVQMLRRRRADYYRDFLAWHVKGCRHERDVVKKLVAIARRVAPKMLDQFGLSQADVSRKFNETRAATSAREKRVYERPLREAGARGILGNGARGAGTSAKCAKAAKGNENRKRGRQQSQKTTMKPSTEIRGRDLSTKTTKP
jgi:hypothetical protein